MKAEIPQLSTGKIPLLIVHHRHQYYKEQLEALSDRFEITSLDHREPIPFDNHPAEILLCWKFQNNLIERLPNLKWINALSAGVDHILDIQDQLESVVVTRAKGTMGSFLAQYCLQHSLNYINNYHRLLKQRQDSKWRFVPSDLLSRNTVTIFGFGSLGSEIGEAFHGLGATIQGVKRNVDDATRAAFPWVSAFYDSESWIQALARSDINILIMPHTPDTERMFDAEAFAAMKKNSLLINIGRGVLINDTDLLESISENKPGMAVLDVFDNEPLPDKHPFWSHPDILVTPHCAGPSEEESLIKEFLTQFDRIKTNKRPLRIVSNSNGY